MGQPRNTHRYHFKRGNTVLRRGITNNLQRREGEHQQTYGSGHITQVGRRTTRQAALRWERRGGKR